MVNVDKMAQLSVVKRWASNASNINIFRAEMKFDVFAIFSYLDFQQRKYVAFLIQRNSKNKGMFSYFSER